jgi:outer membrane receptor protein involved in Fe transport
MNGYMKGCNGRGAVAIAVAAALLGASSVAMAQQSQPVEEVTVTGSRIARPNLESTVPITTVSGEELYQTGNTAVGDLLNDLPSLRSTFSQSNSSRFLGTTGLNLLDLRGLGTQRTLVLVNGRRHVGADILGNAVSPDVNTFPTDLIERIDVVTGGNSAIYGSDAIAGVVNFVLKRDFEGVQFRAQGSNSSEWDSGDYYASLLAGTNFFDNRGNIAANVEYSKQEAFFASDRSNLRKQGVFVVTDSDPAGSPNGSDGIPDRLFYQDVRSATIGNGGSLLIAPRAGSGLAPCGRDSSGAAFSCSFLFQPDGSLVPQTGARIGSAPNGNYDGGNGTNNRERNAVAIFPKLDRASLNVFGHLTLADAFEPFIEAKYVRTDSLRFGQPAFFQGGGIDGDREQPRFGNPFLTDATRAQINAARATMGLAAATADTALVLRRNLLDLGPRQEDATRETTRVVLGVGGKFADDWSYEVAVNYGQFKEDTAVLGNLNKQRFLLAMDSTRDAGGNIVCRSQIDPAAALIFEQEGATAANAFATSLLAGDVAACVPLNPFGDGNITPAMRNYLVQNTTSVAKIKQFVTSATISGNSHRWFDLPAGPIGVAFGVEHRTEENSFKSDALVENGITFYNALPLFDPPKFKVSEAFTEFRVPLLAGKTMADELTFNAAGRYADYEGKTGGVFAHNYGLEWAPIDSLRFRVGKARAVRAPNLVDLYVTPRQNFALNFLDPCSARNIGTGSVTRAANCAAAGRPAAFDYVYTASLEIVSGGNPELKEETSDSLTAGLVFRPDFVPGLSLSIDYFDIDIDDVITAPTAQDILNACYDSASLDNQFCGLFQRAGAGGGAGGEEAFQIIEGSLQQIVLNYASSTSRGIDLEASYSHELGSIGRLNTRLVYTRTLQRDDFLDPSDPQHADQILLELGDPRDAFNLNADLNHGPLTLGYELRFIGRMVLNAYEDTFSVQGRPPQNADYADRRYYPSVVYHDVRASYDFTDSLNAYVGIDNVADKVPPLGLGSGLLLTAEGGGIYDARGRFFFAGAKYNFGSSGR